MTQQAVTQTSRPTVTHELHVFHYLTHSVIVSIDVHDTGECDDLVAHEHTQAGHDLYRWTHLFPSPAAAEDFIARHAEDYAERGYWARNEIFRHDTAPAGRPLAVKIEASNDGNGNPQRGWLIYTPAGRYLGFLDEGHSGTEPLKTLAATELCTIATTAGTYGKVSGEPYPHRR